MGCEGCARAVLLLFNLIFFLVGVACLGVGIWVIVDGDIFLEVLGNIPNSGTAGKLIADAAYIFIGGGALIFLIAFLGCCGAWKKNKCMLVTYAVVIGILLALQIACVVVAYFFYDTVIGTVNGELAAVLNNSYTSVFTENPNKDTEFTYAPGSLVSKGIDAIQVEFSCCGVNNYTDYVNGLIPPTCCPTAEGGDLKALADKLWKDEVTTFTVKDSECPRNATYIAGANIGGCTQAITDYVKEKSLIFMVIAGCTLGVQLLLIILSCCVFCAVRNEEKH